MNTNNITEKAVETKPVSVFRKKIGSTTYAAKVRFSNTAKETLEVKIKRMPRRKEEQSVINSF